MRRGCRTQLTFSFQGCGDVRNVLCTAYANSKGDRPLTLTCCDFEGAITARNVLLLSLIFDKPSTSTLDALRNIYYHLWLSDEDLKILDAQARKLLEVSASLEAWNSSRYSESLKFHDARSLAEVRRVWQSYHHPEDPVRRNAAQSKIVKERIEGAQQFRRHVFGDKGVSWTGFRSAAPVGAKALSDLNKVYDLFWKHGRLPLESNDEQSVHIPNPLFASTLTATSTFHYGSDPLLGFHVAAAYLHLTGQSSLRSEQSTKNNLQRLAKTARSQFKAWATAFSARTSRIVVEVIVGDAFETCTSLTSPKSGPNSNQPDAQVAARRRFNVIDTSNLADHLGLMNLLIYKVPLLEKLDQSTLHTDILVKREGSLK